MLSIPRDNIKYGIISHWLDVYQFIRPAITFFVIFSPKHLVGVIIFYTFALAFRKYADGQCKKEFFEKIYIDREVVQEASPCVWHSLCAGSWVEETNRSMQVEHFIRFSFHFMKLG